MPINLDKKEYVCPWCLGGGAKLIEWAAKSQGPIFTLLWRKSDHGGGGDFEGYRRGCYEGGPVSSPANSIAGRWASDRVAFVGEYDSSRLWHELPQYRNVSAELVETWNEFLGLPQFQLTYAPCSLHDGSQVTK